MKTIGIIIAAVFLFVLQRIVYEKLWDKNLKVSVSFTQKNITEGEEGEIVEVIENRKYLPVPVLKVKFQTSKNLEFTDDIGSKTTDQYYRNDVFQIGGGEKITRKLTFKGKLRGYYHIKNIDLLGSDLFFTSEYIKSMTTNCYLYVYPKVFDSGEFQLSLQKLNGEILVKRHLLEDPFEYRGIREYQPFDDIRSVNWKATARTGALKVNQKNYTAMQAIRIFLNIEDRDVWKKTKEVEASMQIVMGLASYFLAQGIKVSCYANGKDIITGEPVNIDGGAGIGQQDAIGKALARIDTEKEAWNFKELFEKKILDERDGLFTLFVSPNGYKDFTELLKLCQRKNIEYAWFYPHAYAERPEVPKELQGHVQFVYLKQ